MALRLVPLLFGIALIALAIWVGRRWLGSLATALLVLLCTFGQSLVHYRFEVKHYTADAFFALLLPALAVRAIEGDSPRRRQRRLLVFWAAATVGQSIANGALLVTPAIAVLLVATMWHRYGKRAAATVIGLGAIWAGFFVVHYFFSLRVRSRAPIFSSSGVHNWRQSQAVQ
jgi:uncharacterized membrane protein